MVDNKVVVILVFTVLISGCVQEEQEIREIMIPGHGDQTYEFSHDVRKSLLVSSNDPAKIQQLVWSRDKVNIAFDGSNDQDNAYFQVVSFNAIVKLQAYFAYEGKIFNFDTFYFVDAQWYNRTGGEIDVPALDGVTIWFIGPNTGANETSVNIENNVVYIQGTSYKNLSMATDKFSLISMGVDRIE